MGIPESDQEVNRKRKHLFPQDLVIKKKKSLKIPQVLLLPSHKTTSEHKAMHNYKILNVKHATSGIRKGKKRLKQYMPNIW